jgi:putative signal transducing protein
MASYADGKPNPNEKLVRVFDSDQESETMVVRGLLESSGIECDMANLEAPQDILPGIGGIVILVREEDAAEARKIIEENRRPLTDTEEDA